FIGISPPQLVSRTHFSGRRRQLVPGLSAGGVALCWRVTRSAGAGAARGHESGLVPPGSGRDAGGPGPPRREDWGGTSRACVSAADRRRSAARRRRDVAARRRRGAVAHGRVGVL